MDLLERLALMLEDDEVTFITASRDSSLDPATTPLFPTVSHSLDGFKIVNFVPAEGKEYLLKMKVVNGELECTMWEKPA